MAVGRAYRKSLEVAHAATGVVQCACGARATGAPSLVELELAGWSFDVRGLERLGYTCGDCSSSRELELELVRPACDGCEAFGQCVMHAIDPRYVERRCSCGTVITSPARETCGACMPRTLFAQPKARAKKAPKKAKHCKRCRTPLAKRYRARECTRCRQQPLPLVRPLQQTDLFSEG